MAHSKRKYSIFLFFSKAGLSSGATKYSPSRTYRNQYMPFTLSKGMTMMEWNASETDSLP